MTTSTGAYVCRFDTTVNTLGGMLVVAETVWWSKECARIRGRLASDNGYRIGLLASRYASNGDDMAQDILLFGSV
jgi:hypothetical protein